MEGTQDTGPVTDQELLVGFPLTGVLLFFSPYFPHLLLPTPGLSSPPVFLLLSLFPSSSDQTTQISGEERFSCLQEALLA